MAERQACFLPDAAEAEDFDAEVVQKPENVGSRGSARPGHLARSLFFLGLCEEQALVARIRDKGLVVITGCGHPTVEVILEMVRRLSDEPIYAIAGGIHFPVTKSRSHVVAFKSRCFSGPANHHGSESAMTT